MGGRGGVVELDGERYVKLSNGNLLLECWMDIYEWFEGGRAPDEWIVRLNKTAPAEFSEHDRIREQNTQLV